MKLTNNKWTSGLAALILTALLAGCAAQRHYDLGMDLAEQDKPEQAVGELEQAVKLSPRNTKYRAKLITVRETGINQLNDKAYEYLAARRTDEAEAGFKRVLSVDSTNWRAVSGLKEVARVRRHAAEIEQATAAKTAGDLDVARRLVSQILIEDPGNPAANELSRSLEGDTSKPENPKLSEALRKPITIEFKDASLKQIFEVLSRSSGLNFLFDRDIRTETTTTIFLRNSTIEAAVNLILLTNQLEQRVIDENTIIIFPNTAAKLHDYQQLVVRSFWLSTADAKQVANTIRSIVKSKDVIVDEKLNMIIVRDSAEAVKVAEKLVALQDVPEPEVMLEVEILEIKRSKLNELGIRWPSQVSMTPLTSSTTGSSVTLNDLRNLSASRTGVIIDPTTVNIRQTDSDTNLLANPRIRAKNREKARVLIGDRLPTITSTSTATGFVSESVSYIDVGLKLDVEPTVYLDSDVSIKISLEVSNIVSQIQTRSGTLAYQLGTRSASTTLRLRDGENQVLAGLIQDDERKAGNRIPILGELPVLGRLFGSQSNDKAKTEIVLSITPRLIRNIRRPDAPLSQFDTGTEATLKVRSGMGSSSASAVPTPGSVGQTASTTEPAATTPATEEKSSDNSPTTDEAGTQPSSSVGIADPTATSMLPAIPQVTNPALTNVGSALPAALLSWQSPSTAKVGDTFVMQLAMQSTQPLTSVPMTISYDPDLLQLVSVNEGSFMRQNNVLTRFTNRVDVPGQIMATITRNDGSGASGNATLLNVTFTAKAPSNSTLVRIANVAAVDSNGNTVIAQPATPPALQIIP